MLPRVSVDVLTLLARHRLGLAAWKTLAAAVKKAFLSDLANGTTRPSAAYTAAPLMNESGSEPFGICEIHRVRHASTLIPCLFGVNT